MIVDAFVQILSGLLTGLVTMLPAWSLPDMLTATWPGDLARVVAWANGYFPVFDVGICLGVILALRALLVLWAVAVWVYEHFPFKFT